MAEPVNDEFLRLLHPESFQPEYNLRDAEQPQPQQAALRETPQAPSAAVFDAEDGDEKEVQGRGSQSNSFKVSHGNSRSKPYRATSPRPVPPETPPPPLIERPIRLSDIQRPPRRWTGFNDKTRRGPEPVFSSDSIPPPQAPPEPTLLYLSNLPPEWSDEEIEHFVSAQLRSLPENKLPTMVNVGHVTSKKKSKYATFTFPSVTDADTARLRLYGLSIDTKRLFAKLVTDSAHSVTWPNLHTIRIQGLPLNVSLNDLRALFANEKMPFPRPTHYFLYSRAPVWGLPKHSASAMAVMVFSPGTDVRRHVKLLKAIVPEKYAEDTIVQMCHPLSKSHPTKAGTRVVVGEYSTRAGVHDLFRAFSQAGPIEYLTIDKQSKNTICYIDFADEVDAINACTFDNSHFAGPRNVWIRRVDPLGQGLDSLPKEI